MIGSSRLHQPGWLSGAAHAVIIGLAAQAESAEVWPFALLAMSLVSFFAWVANYRRYRQINDLPTSKVASAAQGYVELFGRAEMLPSTPVTSRLSSTNCCWYCFEIEKKNSDNEWKTMDSGKSVAQFALIDDTGQCVISPDGAEVLTNEHKSWSDGDQRYSEWLLLPKSILYAIGEFKTSTAGAVTADDERAGVGSLLAEWKTNHKALLERFDLNKNGMIDVKEWELARLQAQREVRKHNSELQSQSIEGTHLMRKPGDGRLFLLANEAPNKIGERYRFWSSLHLVVFIGALSVGLIML